MIHAQESIANFLAAQMAANVPDIPFYVREVNQPPEMPGLNIYFYDHNRVSLEIAKPAWRELPAAFELLVTADPEQPLVASRQALEAMHLINLFMGTLAIDKKNHATDPPVSMGSQVEWSQSYPLNWRSSTDQNERYIHKTCSIVFRYFEEAA
jgi:hypothetical protein